MTNHLNDDPFDLLAEIEVPEVPAQFDRRLHQRLNAALLSAHLLEFVCYALPGALLAFLVCVGNWMAYTATGRTARNDSTLSND